MIWRSLSTMMVGYLSCMEAERSGAGDDRFDRPMVTPMPAPADDQLVKLVALSALGGAVAASLFWRWFRTNIRVSRR